MQQTMGGPSKLATILVVSLASLVMVGGIGVAISMSQDSGGPTTGGDTQPTSTTLNVTENTDQTNQPGPASTSVTPTSAATTSDATTSPGDSEPGPVATTTSRVNTVPTTQTNPPRASLPTTDTPAEPKPKKPKPATSVPASLIPQDPTTKPTEGTGAQPGQPDSPIDDDESPAEPIPAPTP